MILKLKEAISGTKWCGVPIVVMDCLAIITLLAYFTLSISFVGFGVIATFVLGPPLVHLYRGHWCRAGVSFALRALGPVIGAIYFSPSSGGYWLDEAVNGAIGMALGALVAMLTDWIFIARCKIEKDEDAENAN